VKTELSHHTLRPHEKARNFLLSTTMVANVGVTPIAFEPSCDYTIRTTQAHEAMAPEGMGLTFGSIAAEFHGLDPHRTLESLLGNELSEATLVRLGAYMNQPTDEMISELSWQISIAQKYDKHVVLTVGGKAPHYPEWYIDPKAKDEEIEKATAVIDAFGDNPTVSHFQLSNEPFHADYQIQPEHDGVLDKIYEQMRKYGKPIIVTMLAHPSFFSENQFIKAVKYADIVGLDLYTQIGFSRVSCEQMRSTMQRAKALAEEQDVKLWVTESQTLSWEPKPHTNHLYNYLYRPFTPDEIMEQYKMQNLYLQPEAILPFDMVSVYDRAIDGNPNVLNVVDKILQLQQRVNQQNREKRAQSEGVIISFSDDHSRLSLEH
jgi:hypothetical protein